VRLVIEENGEANEMEWSQVFPISEQDSCTQEVGFRGALELSEAWFFLPHSFVCSSSHFSGSVLSDSSPWQSDSKTLEGYSFAQNIVFIFSFLDQIASQRRAFLILSWTMILHKLRNNNKRTSLARLKSKRLRK
jgi:hypothetical protein